MRIALLTDGISPYVIGGMQKHSFYVAKYLAKNKIYVDLYHCNNSALDIYKAECFSEEEKKYVTSIVLDFPITIKFPGHYLFASYKYSKLIFNHIRHHLHIYNFIYAKGFTGWKLIDEKQKGNVVCCDIGINFHGYEMFQIAPDLTAKMKQFVFRSTVKSLSLKADKVFSYGGKITTIIKNLGVKNSNIIELPSGVEPEKINTEVKLPNKFLHYVFLGRSERRKGILELNNVLTELLAQKQEFNFSFIGPIPENEKIIHPSICYYGEIRNSDKINALLRNADVLVCPSWSEGFPNSILEGMCSGLAIIATNVGAVSELVDPKNGWLIEVPEVPLLKNVMILAQNDPYIYAKKMASIKKIEDEFNWEVIIKNLIAWMS